MITDNHRLIADLAQSVLSLGKERRATFLQALSQKYPMISFHTTRVMIDGDKLRTLRKAEKLSQAALARKVGVTTTQLWLIENGKSGTTRHRVLKIAEVLHVPISEITAT